MWPFRSVLTALSFAAFALAPFSSPGQGEAPAEGADLAAPVIQRDAAGVVTLAGTTPGAVIRYSLDNSDPGPKAGPYLAPIVLPSGGVVKARAFTEDRKQKSELAEARFEPLLGSGPEPSTLVPCTQDRDWPTYDWAKRHAAVTEIVKEHKPLLIFIGDSITHLFGGEPHDRGQPGKAIWEQRYGARNAANLGFGYDYVENALWRLSHGELDGAEAKAIVILIGTNNLGKNSETEIATGIVAVCAEAHRRQPAAGIVLLGIFPAGPAPDAKRAKIAAINQLLAKAAEANHIIFLDFGAKFLEPDGQISREIMSDYLHPTAKGYEIWTRELEPTLSKLLGD